MFLINFRKTDVVLLYIGNLMQLIFKIKPFFHATQLTGTEK